MTDFLELLVAMIAGLFLILVLPFLLINDVQTRESDWIQKIKIVLKI